MKIILTIKDVKSYSKTFVIYIVNKGKVHTHTQIKNKTKHKTHMKQTNDIIYGKMVKENERWKSVLISMLQTTDIRLTFFLSHNKGKFTIGAI